jgi:integrase
MSAKNVSEMFELFVKLREMSDGTKQIYGRARDLLIEQFGDVPVDQFTALDAQVWVQRLKERTWKDKPVTATTVNMYTRAIKAFFSWLFEAEVLGKNPFGKLKPLREERQGKPPYENDEMTRLLRFCQGDRWRLIMALAVTTGMRRGEILNLTIDELDYHEGLIQIKPKVATAHTWPWTIKDRQARCVPMTAMVESMLLRRQAVLPAGQPYVCLDPHRYAHLIARHRSKGLPYDQRKCPENNFNRMFKEVCGRAQVPPGAFHALRGSALSVMAENGLQPHELAEIGGHSDVRTTYRHYVRPRTALYERTRHAALKLGGTGLEPVTPCL